MDVDVMVLPILMPTAEEYAQYVIDSQPVPKGESVKLTRVKEDPVYFVINQLGIRPRFWQARMLRDMAAGKKVQACTSRQIGKSSVLCWFALWAITYNMFPLESTKKTRILIVSATDDQSKKLISDLRDWMALGDDRIFNLTRRAHKNKAGEVVEDGVKNFFTSKINKEARNNTEAITLDKGDVICLPPTKKVRGWTASWVFVDEAAFIEEETLFEEGIRPVVSQTGNKIALTSTPNGSQGFFYKHFDPNDDFSQHEFLRYWVPFTALEFDDAAWVEQKRLEESQAISFGNERAFQQEYMASFNSATASFFDAEDVDRCVRSELDIPARYDKPCDLAVDFGAGKVSRTVITITALENEGTKQERIRLVYQYEFPPDKDSDLMERLVGLRQRFPNIQRTIFEDCPAAAHYIQKAQLLGWDLRLFNPSSEKAPKYFALKHCMKLGGVQMPFLEDLSRQMKGLVQEDGAKVTKIHHGAGLLDDRIDSFMMSTYFFTEERPSFRVWDIDEV